MLSANKGKQRLLSTPEKFGGGQADGLTPSPDSGIGADAPSSSGRYRLYEFVVTVNGTVDIAINVDGAGEAIVTGFGRASSGDTRMSSAVRVGDALIMVGGFEVSSAWKGRPHGHSSDEDAIHALLDRAPRPTILKLRSQEQQSSRLTNPKAVTGALIKARTVELCNESRAQGSMVSYLRIKTALLLEFSKDEIDGNKGMVQECIVMAYREEEGPIHSQPSLITGEVGRVDTALGRKDYSVLPNDLEIRIQFHSHKLRIVPPHTERGAGERLWLCKLCRGHEQHRVTFRFRCCMTCDWDVCDVCVSTILGKRKFVTLRRTVGVPVGIQFSGTVVTAVVEGTPAAECGQIYMNDVVISVNKAPVKTLNEISGLLQESHGKVLLELAEPFPSRARERRKKLISVGKDGSTSPVASPSTTPHKPSLVSFAEKDEEGVNSTMSIPFTPTMPSSTPSSDRTLSERTVHNGSPATGFSSHWDVSSMDVASLQSALRQMEHRCGQLITGTQRLQRALDSSTELLSFCENKHTTDDAKAKIGMENANARTIKAESRADAAEARALAAEQAASASDADIQDLNAKVAHLSDQLAAAKSNEKCMLVKCATVGKQNHLLELELEKVIKKPT